MDYGDGVGHTVEENSGVFSVTQMYLLHKLCLNTKFSNFFLSARYSIVCTCSVWMLVYVFVSDMQEEKITRC